MKTRLLLVAILLLLAALFWRLNQPARPDPRMVALAVRATLYALPTTTPRQIIVTQIVVVTPTPALASTATLTPTPTLTPTQLPAATPAEALAAIPETQTSTPAPEAAAPPQPLTTVEDSAAVKTAETNAAQPDAIAMAAAAVGECPTSSTNDYAVAPVAGGGLGYPDNQHADLNLTLRGYTAIDAPPALFDKDGPVDSDPPQLASLFADNRTPQFGQAYRVNDWDWGCAAQGCLGAPLTQIAVTLVALQSNAGEPVRIPRRSAQVYDGGYKALVLYAEATRITLGYTREDSVANGYAIHIENVCVDPNLLAAYQGSAAAGRGSLPALREEQTLGTASLGDILVAVRDRGVFFDPRSRLDWWQGY